MMLFAFELLVSNIQTSIRWNRLCLHFIDNLIQTRTLWGKRECLQLNPFITQRLEYNAMMNVAISEFVDLQLLRKQLLCNCTLVGFLCK